MDVVSMFRDVVGANNHPCFEVFVYIVYISISAFVTKDSGQLVSTDQLFHLLISFRSRDNNQCHTSKQLCCNSVTKTSDAQRTLDLFGGGGI